MPFFFEKKGGAAFNKENNLGGWLGSFFFCDVGLGVLGALKWINKTSKSNKPKHSKAHNSREKN